ncbi:MAG: DUF4159 domain-containing protein [Cyclobacteriaceae bacterium]|nr:DUF4159 domain-containing protein [Cyclobacteriaceae bacterium]
MKINTLKFTLICLLVVFICLPGLAQLKIAKLKYQGGGDWYANKTALPNLIAFCNRELNMNLAPQEEIVDASSSDIFLYPYVYMTGHGNVVFSQSEAENLRKYVLGGGFLHIDDNYGMDKFIRIELKKIFPQAELTVVPFDHPVYKQKYTFNNGLPKIHEHDGKPAQGLGIFFEGRLVIYYSYESDLGNGWEDQRIHNDPEAKRLEAFKMGANLIAYCMTNF